MKILRFFVILLAFLFLAPTVLLAAKEKPGRPNTPTLTPTVTTVQEKPVPILTPTPAVTIVTGGSLFRAGETVVIDEAVKGDVFCAGQSVTIKGSVSGDVICASQNLSIEGEVQGSVRVIGQYINLASAIGRNVTALGQSLTLSQEGSVGGEFLAAGQTVLLNGKVGQWVKVAGQSVALNGQVGEDVYVTTETLTVGDGAVVDGALSYQAAKQMTLPGSARVKGPVTFTEITEEQKVSKKTTRTWPASAVGAILVYTGVGLLIIIFTKKLFPAVTGHMRAKPLWTLVLGVAGVVFTPLVLLVLTLTIIGIPVALLAGMIYVLVLMVATLFTAVIAGQWVLEALAPKLKGNPVYQVLVGVPITFLTLKMPFLGMILGPFALFWGVGGIVSSILAKRKK